MSSRTMEFPCASRCTCKTAYVQHYLNCCEIFAVWSLKLVFGQHLGSSWNFGWVQQIWSCSATNEWSDPRFIQNYAIIQQKLLFTLHIGKCKITFIMFINFIFEFCQVLKTFWGLFKMLYIWSYIASYMYIGWSHGNSIVRLLIY